MTSSPRIGILFGILFFFSVSPAFADAVTLAWDANVEPDLAGYKIYYKTGSPGAPYDGKGALEGDSPITI